MLNIQIPMQSSRIMFCFSLTFTVINIVDPAVALEEVHIAIVDK